MTEVLAERKIWWFGRLKTVRVSKPDPRGSTKLLAYWIENDRAVLIPEEWVIEGTLCLRSTRSAVITEVAYTIAGFNEAQNDVDQQAAQAD